MMEGKQIGGFTPVIDILAEEVGMVEALVYGVVWRYCQAGDGTCKASLNLLASHIAADKKTVERHIKTLCEIGYLRAMPAIPAHLLHPSADDGRCGYCDTIFGYLDTHHIIPLSENGPDIPSNITYLCPNCHRLAHSIQYIADCKILADGWRFKNAP